MRIVVAGPSGSGKTTFAARLGRLLDIPHTEMDSLHWGPNWTPRPSFEADVQRLIEQPAWITEWQYPQVRGRLLERADVVIYLRYSRAVVMWRVVRRTVRRAVTGQKLWADNVEPPLKNILRDPDNMIRYTWRSYRMLGSCWRRLVGSICRSVLLSFVPRGRRTSFCVPCSCAACSEADPLNQPRLKQPPLKRLPSAVLKEMYEPGEGRLQVER